jgi:hypothetical protein
MGQGFNLTPGEWLLFASNPWNVGMVEEWNIDIKSG